jgi:RecB family exonuclease
VQGDGPPAAGAQPWLAPSSAARLLTCPASVGARLETGAGSQEAAAAPGHGGGTPPNAGTLAHAAVASWIGSGAWQGPDAPQALAYAYRSAAQDAGVHSEKLPGGRMTEARLRVRAAALAGYLRDCGTGTTFECELPLADAATRLHGVVDLLVTSPASRTVLDLKTGRDTAGPSVPPATMNQLLIYGYLVERARGGGHLDLAVFSLHTGLLRFPYTSGAAEALVERIIAARRQWSGGDRGARPSPETCRYCHRRLSCDPHWEAVKTWEDPGGVEGTVLRAAHSENGHTSLLIDTAAGRGWLTRIPRSALTAGVLASAQSGSSATAPSLAPGSWVRAAPVHTMAGHDRTISGSGWTATDWTLVSVRSPSASTSD